MSNAETDSIFLDFAKAFDKVDHQILLQKIKNLGITGKLYDWLAEFLSNREQVVVLDGIMSYIAAVISGQGGHTQIENKNSEFFQRFFRVF